IWNTVVERIDADGQGLVNNLRLRDVNTGIERGLAATGLFVFVGFRPNTGIIEGHVEHDSMGYLITDPNMQTSIPGLFAAGAVRAVRRAWKVPVLMHANDLPLYRRAVQQAALYGLPFEQPDDPDRFLQAGDSLTLGAHTFTVRHVPGHSPGHVVFLCGTLML